MVRLIGSATVIIILDRMDDQVDLPALHVPDFVQ